MNRGVLAIIGLCLLTGCKPSSEELARKQVAIQEARKKECLDQICRGDVVPKYDPATEAPFKVGGQIFIGPKAYGVYGGSFAFFWPSKVPSQQIAREFIPSGPNTPSNFYEVAIEVFMRAKEGPPSELSGYDLLLKADAEGKILSKTKLRKGLEAWRTQDEIRKDGTIVWYIATDLKDNKEDPSALACSEHDPKFDRCTTAFIWRPGIVVDLRFRAKHGTDWPEIHQEIVRVLSLIRQT